MRFSVRARGAFAAAACCAFLAGAFAPASFGQITMGPLRPLPANPHYFTDGSGKAILLTGSHSWDDFQDTGQSNSPAAFDFTSYVNFLKAHNQTTTILWRKDLPTYCFWGAGGTWHMTPFPWLRTGPGTASDGQPKFDLSQFNQAYFDRLRSRVVQLQQNGIYAIVQLFDGLGINYDRCGTTSPSGDGYPFTGVNNINGIDDGYVSGASGTASMTMTAANAITNIQDAYVEKVIDTLYDLPNVLWEISEEAPDNSTWWQNHMISLIHSYEQGTYGVQHPVGFPSLDVTGSSDSTLYNSNADWVAPKSQISPTSSCGSGSPVCKVNINDSDHSNYFTNMMDSNHNIVPQLVHNYIWENFVNGSQVLFMDPYEIYWPSNNRNLCSNPVNGVCSGVDSKWNNLRDNLGYTAMYAAKMNLAAMTPQPGLSSTGYCLANAAASGSEFLIYAPSGGPFTVNLSNTLRTLSVEWFNPSTGATSSAGTVAGGSSARSFTPPFSGEAVLYLVDSGASGGDTTPPTVPANVTVGAVSSTTVTLSWSASTDPDSPVAGYKIYRNGSQVGTTASTTYQDTGLSPSTAYSYTVAAYDPSGNTSAQSAPVSATTQPAVTNSGITIVQHAGVDCGTSNFCTVVFPQPVTAGDFIAVGVRVGAELGSVSLTDTAGNKYVQAIQISNPNDIHQLYVFYAENILGGSDTVQMSVSTSSPTTRMTVAEYSGVARSGSLDQTAGAVGSGTAVNSGNITTTAGGELLLGFGANASGVAWTAGPNWTLRDAPAEKMASEDQVAASALTTSATFTLAASDFWTAAIVSFKPAGTSSDTTPPTVPTSVTATSTSSSSITVSWSASTDPDSPVAGYKIFRGGTQISTSTTTSYNDTGLTPSTTYSYTVAAYDPSGNTSAQSAAASATTKAAADITPPTVPGGLTATAVSSTEIKLSWSASTDPDSPVAGYKVSRNGSQVGTTTSTTYQDTGLSPSTTYSYTVAAYDPSGNTSAQSAPVSATTQAAVTNSGIAIVQHAGVDCGTSNSCTLVFPQPVTAGDFIAVGVSVGREGHGQGGGRALGTVTLTDTAGNTYVQAIQISNPNDVHQLYVFYAENILGGSDIVQLSASTSDATTRMTIAEYSGVARSGSLDQTAGAVGSGTAVNSGNITTTAGGELLLGFGANASGISWTAGPNWTLRDAPGEEMASEDQVAASALTTSATFTLAASDFWTAAIVSFKPAGM